MAIQRRPPMHERKFAVICDVAGNLILAFKPARALAMPRRLDADLLRWKARRKLHATELGFRSNLGIRSDAGNRSRTERVGIAAHSGERLMRKEKPIEDQALAVPANLPYESDFAFPDGKKGVGARN